MDDQRQQRHQKAIQEFSSTVEHPSAADFSYHLAQYLDNVAMQVEACRTQQASAHQVAPMPTDNINQARQLLTDAHQYLKTTATQIQGLIYSEDSTVFNQQEELKEYILALDLIYSAQKNLLAASQNQDLLTDNNALNPLKSTRTRWQRLVDSVRSFFGFEEVHWSSNDYDRVLNELNEHEAEAVGDGESLLSSKQHENVQTYLQAVRNNEFAIAIRPTEYNRQLIEEELLEKAQRLEKSEEINIFKHNLGLLVDSDIKNAVSKQIPQTQDETKTAQDQTQNKGQPEKESTVKMPVMATKGLSRLAKAASALLARTQAAELERIERESGVPTDHSAKPTPLEELFQEMNNTIHSNDKEEHLTKLKDNYTAKYNSLIEGKTEFTNQEKLAKNKIETKLDQCQRMLDRKETPRQRQR